MLPPPPASEAGSPDIDSLIKEISAKNNVDPELTRSVIKQESNFDPKAKSSAGAQGLMQLMPATQDRFGVTDPFDARQSIDGGTRYLRFLLDKFNGKLDLALAGYNAGENLVAKIGRVPEIPETKDYVNKIMTDYNGKKLPVQPVSGKPPISGVNYTAADLANYVRSKVPEAKDQPDWVLSQYMLEKFPELKQNTKLQSGQEASRMAFEGALPPEKRSLTGGFVDPNERLTNPSNAGVLGGALRDWFLDGMQGLQNTTSHPIKSGIDLVQGASNYLGRSFDPAYRYTTGQSLPDVNVPGTEGPRRILNAKTPEDLIGGAASTLTQTLPTVAAAGSAIGSAYNAIPEGTGAKAASATETALNIPPRAMTRGIANTDLNALGSKIMDLGAQIKKAEESPGIIEQIIRRFPGAKQVEDKLRANIGDTVSSVGKGMMDNPQFKGEVPGGASIINELKAGIPADTLKNLGTGKLIDIANNIKQDPTILDKLDSLVGGREVRQRILSSSEGQNHVYNLVSAMRQQNPTQILRHANLIKDFLDRSQARPIIPPPPG